MPGLLVGEFVETVMAVVRRLRAHAAPDLDDIAAALPSPPSSSTAYLPAARPISLLSPPTNCVYLSVSTLRSSTKTGILASIACSTTPVRPADSFGEIKQRVDLLADQVLDVGDLLFGLVLAVGDDQLDFRMLRGLGDDVLVELGAPRLDRGRLARNRSSISCPAPKHLALLSRAVSQRRQTQRSGRQTSRIHDVSCASSSHVPRHSLSRRRPRRRPVPCAPAGRRQAQIGVRISPRLRSCTSTVPTMISPFSTSCRLELML